jgi:hypothetical protein
VEYDKQKVEVQKDDKKKRFRFKDREIKKDFLIEYIPGKNYRVILG